MNWLSIIASKIVLVLSSFNGGDIKYSFSPCAN